MSGNLLLKKKLLHKHQVKNIYNNIAGHHSTSRLIYTDRILLEYINNITKKLNQSIIFDIGTGEGILPQFISENNDTCYQIIGLDLSEKMIYNSILLNINSDNSSFIIGDIDNLSIKNNTISYFILRFVLHHLYDPNKVIKQLYKLLKPNGCIIVCDGIIPYCWETLNFINRIGKIRDPSHSKYYSLEEMKEMMIQNNFHIIETNMKLYTDEISLREWINVFDSNSYNKIFTEFFNVNSNIKNKLHIQYKTDDVEFKIPLGIIVAKKLLK